MKLTIKQLEILLAVANAGSINNARKTLKLAQPTISQQLSKMECALGSQLFKRGQPRGLTLTPAGEFWVRQSIEILDKVDLAINTHNSLFSNTRIELRFGATPSLLGRFHEQAALISSNIPTFSRFEFVWALTSVQIVEMIKAHQINCAIVSQASVESYSNSLSISELFDDDLVWVVPNTIKHAQLKDIFKNRSRTVPKSDAIYRYVQVGPGVHWMNRVKSWYEYNLPNAEPYFSCGTHSSAIDIVAAGLATCFCPMSLLPNLPEYLLKRVHLFTMNEPARTAVFIMPKHLLSINAFVEFRHQITKYVKENYCEKYIFNSLDNIQKFSFISDT